MGNRLAGPVTAGELASRLGLALKGNDHVFDRVLPLDVATSWSLTFCTRNIAVERSEAIVIIAPPGTSASGAAMIEAENPRLAFAKALMHLNANPGFVLPQEVPQIHPTAAVAASAVLGRGVTIGKGSVVGPFVYIGDGVQIGEDCLIKPSAVIGDRGFAFERDTDGTPLVLIHLGTVVIGDRVEVGSFTTVCRGTLTDTEIHDDAKVDDHCHVAHNCRIGRAALVSACAELSGSVELGEFAWVGPNSSILQKVKVGAGALIGSGANVLRSVAPGDKVVGNPARSLGRNTPQA
jgi:UDP-3-O-[3-hydroxymyristoyl] glucosamine N-acyltransferase